MSEPFFIEVPERVPFGGLDSADPLSFKVYRPDRMVMGKRMEDHLRIAVCLWHGFNWPGTDMFGWGTFDRPWLQPGAEPLRAARAKLDAAFEFIATWPRAPATSMRSGWSPRPTRRTACVGS